VRNFIIELTAMPNQNCDDSGCYPPTGIQYDQQSAIFPSSTDKLLQLAIGPVHRFAEYRHNHASLKFQHGCGCFHGEWLVSFRIERLQTFAKSVTSGGFASDLTFVGGSIGFKSGNQNFVARNLTFTSCSTAISMIWDWTVHWKSITVESCNIAVDLSQFRGDTGQGTGSLSLTGELHKASPANTN
jgi:hypothetical protein